MARIPEWVIKELTAELSQKLSILTSKVEELTLEGDRLRAALQAVEKRVDGFAGHASAPYASGEDANPERTKERSGPATALPDLDGGDRPQAGEGEAETMTDQPVSTEAPATVTPPGAPAPAATAPDPKPPASDLAPETDAQGAAPAGDSPEPTRPAETGAPVSRAMLTPLPDEGSDPPPAPEVASPAPQEPANGEAVKPPADPADPPPAVKEPEPETGPSLEALIELALSQQCEQGASDAEKLTEYEALAREWQQRSAALIQGLLAAKEEVDRLLDRSGELQSTFVPQVQEALAGRQSGLELVRKMYGRLEADGGDLVEDADAPLSLPALTPEECRAAVDGVAGEQWEKKLADRVRAHSESCWRLVTGRRDTADQRIRRFKSFVERKLLPILDALEDGERVSRPLIARQVEEHPQAEAALQQWLGTYQDLLSCLEGPLAQEAVGVTRIQKPEPDTPLDFDRFEPFETVADANRKDETVVEITRAGYELCRADGTTLLIRAAQATVVKN